MLSTILWSVILLKYSKISSQMLLSHFLKLFIWNNKHEITAFWERHREGGRSQIRITRRDKIPKGLWCVIFSSKFKSSHATNSPLECPPHGFQTSSQAYLGIYRWQATPSRLNLACTASSGMQSGNSGWLKRFIHFCVNVYASPGQASPGSSHTFP